MMWIPAWEILCLQTPDLGAEESTFTSLSTNLAPRVGLPKHSMGPALNSRRRRILTAPHPRVCHPEEGGEKEFGESPPPPLMDVESPLNCSLFPAGLALSTERTVMSPLPKPISPEREEIISVLEERAATHNPIMMKEEIASRSARHRSKRGWPLITLNRYTRERNLGTRIETTTLSPSAGL